ncbi:sensor histidine kinase [Lysobacter panacisoli]|uniref:Histidine kinase n=1 Tax=Lysobacter panacisoli TaxID=1255263 RepID=A0ABP9L5X8_9GAMM|nr:histidine kinase [Lysobacter panacisoli]
MTRNELRFVCVNSLYGIAYAAMNVLFFSQFARLDASAWMVSIALGFGVWAVTSTLRIVAVRRQWLERGNGRFALILAASIVLGALATLLFTTLLLNAADALGWIVLPGRSSLAQMVGYWTNIAIIIGLWVAFWAGWQALGRYRHGEIARLRAESQRSALELDALRARLNPHFVFNALNNVRALINEDPARARETVTRLSNILRHALEHSQRDWATLGEEIAVVDDYLAVESVHYEERLRVRRDIDANALDAKLPPMALQLLVENAIKHGIANQPGGGDLTLSARREHGRLRLEVGSPGRITVDPSRRGVGLAYLRTRLQRADAPGTFELLQDDTRVLARLELPQ